MRLSRNAKTLFGISSSESLGGQNFRHRDIFSTISIARICTSVRVNGNHLDFFFLYRPNRLAGFISFYFY